MAGYEIELNAGTCKIDPDHPPMQRGQLAGCPRIQFDYPVEALFQRLEGEVAHRHTDDPVGERRGREETQRAQSMFGVSLHCARVQ